MTDRDDAIVAIQSAMRAHAARKKHLGEPGNDLESRVTRTRGRYYDVQLSKAREKFRHKVLTFKLPCCQGQLALFPRETA